MTRYDPHMAEAEEHAQVEPVPQVQRATQIASERVGSIVAAAEQAADELRAETERRARERLAEAGRAGTNRVEAAEAEARDILHTAREQAGELPPKAPAHARRAASGGRAGRRPPRAATPHG